VEHLLTTLAVVVQQDSHLKQEHMQSMQVALVVVELAQMILLTQFQMELQILAVAVDLLVQVAQEQLLLDIR
jgi:hypothetical protein